MLSRSGRRNCERLLQLVRRSKDRRTSGAKLPRTACRSAEAQPAFANALQTSQRATTANFRWCLKRSHNRRHSFLAGTRNKRILYKCSGSQVNQPLARREALVYMRQGIKIAQNRQTTSWLLLNAQADRKQLLLTVNLLQPGQNVRNRR